MSQDRLHHIREFWDQHARTDPLWAILSDPSKKGRLWRLKDFFETGRREISLLLYRLKIMNAEPPSRRALDFGCGIGRLTQSLAAHFDSVVGVDISPTMIRLANLINPLPGKIRYYCNEAPHLHLFPDEEFSFIYSNIVLQHIPPDLSLGYLSEFLRILKTEGLLVFQLPSHRRPTFPAREELLPMEDRAYAAQVRLEGVPKTVLPSGAECTLKVSVKNTSPCDWAQRPAAPIRVGNHWLTGDGKTMLIQDDGRVALPRGLAAGDECQVLLTIRAPSEPGTYQCEVDLVHESVSWFRDKGSSPPRFVVCVSPEGTDTPSSPHPSLLSEPEIREEELSRAEEVLWKELGPPLQNAREPGEFPMYGISQDRVADFLASCGGRIFFMEEDETSGREWVGFRYYVRKI